MKFRPSLALVLACLFIFAASAQAQEENSGPPYSYLYKGRSVSLHASSKLVALDQKSPKLSAIVSAHRLVRDPLSDRHELKRHGLGIYRAAATGKDKRSRRIRAMLATPGTQPVFEQGGAILIPSDEVIVGFKEETGLGEAQQYLASAGASLGVTGVRPLRQNTFIVTISNASNGRAFEVARGLAALRRVSFAEPNLVVVLRGETGRQELFYDQRLPPHKLLVGSVGVAPPSSAKSAAAPPDWSTIASLDFETDTLPAGWRTVHVTGTPAAYWGSTDFRKNGGSRSLYCAAAGAQAVAAPGPAPLNMAAGLLSPQYDLSGYDEVYLELWFYAKNELDDSGYRITVLDFPAVVVVNDLTGSSDGQYLAVAYDADCTRDPTTANGWRRFLYRVPPLLRSASAHFEIQYISNESNATEGAYIDDLRIVGTTKLDSAPLSNDTYSGRQYELKNVGQLAGLAKERSDMHLPEAWDQVSVSPEIVVAVIDEGVELSHPDLRLVKGYDYNGAVGGQPRSEGGAPRGAHGTACAGNVGAIKDNGIGVVGTAPGVRIMPVYMGSDIGDFASAIDVAVQHGAKILTNSWGWTGYPSATVENAVKAALAAGRVVLFAAGNGPDRPPYTYDVAFPGSLTGTTDVICVGATSPTDEHKSASSSDGEFYWGSSYVGPGPDVCAPGPWSYSTDLIGSDGENNGSQINPSDGSSADYNPAFGGTSSATPKVAGVVALMLSKNPDLTPAQVKSILMSSADDIDVPGVDDKTGAGRVNAYRAVLAVPEGASSGGAPRVLATIPADGALAVPVMSAVSASFSQPMDAASLNGTSFSVDNGVTGSVNYDGSTRLATFTPLSPLAVGVTYTATIGTGARSASGTALGAGRSWSFTTSQSGGRNLVANGDFESGLIGWGGANSAGYGGIVQSSGLGHNGSNGYLVAGSADNVNSSVYQDLVIPAGSATTLRFWYQVKTEESSASEVFDSMAVLLKDPVGGGVLQSLVTLSNLDSAPEWRTSQEFDLSRYQGQALRLEFKVNTDLSFPTTFLVDDVTVAAATAQQNQAVYLYRKEDGAVQMQGASGAVPVSKEAELGRIVAEGDFNGDGVRDFVWWNGVTGEVHIQLMSDATTVLGTALVHREPDTSWRVVAAGDVDGDGKSDLIWHNQLNGTVYVMLIDAVTRKGGATVLTEPDTAWKVVAAADSNGDGKSDLIWWHAISGQVAVTLMNGAAAAPRQVITQAPDTNWRIVGAADLNGDGRVDVVWKNRRSGEVYAMLLNGTTVIGGATLYREPDTNWEIVSVGRYHGGGSADLLWRNAASGRIYIMPLQGMAVAPGRELPAEPDSSWQVVGQQQRLDENYGQGSTSAHADAGHLDWFNSLSGALAGMMFANGIMTGARQYYLEPDTKWQVVGHGDFNGDGVTDSVWRNSVTGEVGIQYMKSPTEVAGSFLLYQEPNTDWRIVATGDVDGDGRTDLIWWNQATGQAYAMLLGPTGVTGGAMIATEPDTRWKIVAAADVDGNGKADLIWWNTASGQVAISQINNVGPTATPVIYTRSDTSWRIVGAGDINGDGKADLIWQNKNSGEVSGTLMNGSSVTGGGSITTAADLNWEIVSVGNYNNDGKADLLWWNRATGEVYLMPLDGLRALPGYQVYHEPDTTWRIQSETEWRDRAYGVGVTTISK